MKTTGIKKLLLTIAAALLGLGSVAGAQGVVSFALDDAAIDYSEPTLTDDPYGYIQFGQDANGLVLVLSTSKLDGSLPVIYLNVPYGGEDQFGDVRDVDVTDLEGISLSAYGGRYSGLAVTHLSSVVADVFDAYSDALGSIGFSTDVEQQGGNVWVGIFQGEAGALRAVFHQSGTTVTVNISRA
ncbi:MAG: hypothetical protein KF813_10410 [Trueperaceae bacterium]|nr:hypothetical protein [Trueperaceae bacterium]